MSGECQMCGEYMTDCTCDDEQEKPRVKPVSIIDKINRLEGLTQCLQFVVNNKDFQLFRSNPHDYLIDTIKDGLEEIEKMVKDL